MTQKELVKFLKAKEEYLTFKAVAGRKAEEFEAKNPVPTDDTKINDWSDAFVDFTWESDCNKEKAETAFLEQIEIFVRHQANKKQWGQIAELFTDKINLVLAKDKIIELFLRLNPNG